MFPFLLNLNVMMPENFIDWYLKIRINKIINHRTAGIIVVWRFINITGLLKTLFAPYRRLSVEGNGEKYNVQTGFDKFVFNAISRCVGAAVRLTLIAAGLLFLFLVLIFSVPYVAGLIILFPLSLPRFQRLQNNRVFTKDLQSKEAFVKKIQKSRIFRYISPFFDAGFTNALAVAEISGFKSGQKISEVLIYLSQNDPNLKSYLEAKSIRAEFFQNLVLAVADYINFKPQTSLAPMGQTLTFGYTKTLEKFSKDISAKTFFLTETERTALDSIVKIITRPSHNDLILVGEPGIGRHETIQNLKTAISTSHFKSLSAKQVLYLDATALAGTGKTLPEVKSNFEAVFDEAESAGNIVLVIDEIDRILTTKDDRLDLAEVITTRAKESELSIIGITTPDDYNEYIRPNSTLIKYFEKVDLEEPTADGTLMILIGRILNSKKERVSAHLDALAEIVKRSDQLIADKKQPEKSLLLFDDAKQEARNRGTAITVELVDEIVSAQTKTPIGALKKGESEKLKDLEVILHKRIIGQEEAIEQIAKAMRRARIEVDESQKPIGSFLFLGPTGVGKTETTKALAEAYFGSETKMVRFDMSEFQGEDAMSRLIGNAATKDAGILASQIRQNPYGILLLDEFEKANKAVHNLFLQVLDEGFLTDASGKKVSFSNIIIIATSNAGAEFIRQQLEDSKTRTVLVQGQSLSKKLIDHILQQGLFNPELINRFDGVIVYHPLTQEEITQVTALMLQSLAKKLKDTKNITLEVTKELAQKVAQAGYDPQFGARPIKRLIQDKIEDEIAKMIIDGSIKNGGTIKSELLIQTL
ncbi:MAG TPA: ATP-dependent Clp protease ATP-binding subunit [Candidatus Saccharimonadales bacterium]|nr:ATP-dependent Clp protease ATP-binding subunit [Candidatus Saccharimonadales bacterium]